MKPVQHFFHQHSVSRRRLLSWAGALAAVCLLPRGHADELVPVAANDSLANSLDYHGNRNKVDTRQYPEFDSSQHCANCQYFDSHNAQSGCKLMPGRQVDPDGWCKVWTERNT